MDENEEPDYGDVMDEEEEEEEFEEEVDEEGREVPLKIRKTSGIPEVFIERMDMYEESQKKSSSHRMNPYVSQYELSELLTQRAQEIEHMADKEEFFLKIKIPEEQLFALAKKEREKMMKHLMRIRSDIQTRLEKFGNWEPTGKNNKPALIKELEDITRSIEFYSEVPEDDVSAVGSLRLAEEEWKYRKIDGYKSDYFLLRKYPDGIRYEVWLPEELLDHHGKLADEEERLF
jgi:hypothetical protein